jgi:predicted chitinase
MKSTLVCWVIGLGAAVGCGGGTEGPRNGDEGIGGATVTGGSSSLGGSGGSAFVTAGTASVAGSTTAMAGTSVGGAGGTSVAPMPCGPDWIAGTAYGEGDIVKYQGGYYIAEHDNPGYDPLISTYFWEPYRCDDSGSAGSGGSQPASDSSFDDVVSEQLFNQLFPNRNQFYSYQGLVDATRIYPAFAGTGSLEQRKREAAAFLANVARETGELIYIDQIEQGEYCMPSDSCPCEPGKRYFGRGPIQISWNYNYCSASAALGVDLRRQPELVSQDATIAWETGLWFWMTQRGAGTMTPHTAITTDRGFGETIRSINGTIECQGNGSTEGVQARVSFFLDYAQRVGVEPGANQTC